MLIKRRKPLKEVIVNEHSNAQTVEGNGEEDEVISPTSRCSQENENKQTSLTAEESVLESRFTGNSEIPSTIFAQVSVSLKKTKEGQKCLPISCLPTSRSYQLSDFQVVRQLGRGQCGEVYLAFDLISHQYVALKIIQQKGDETVYDYFKTEIDIQSHLKHPNIIQLYGYFVKDGTLYMVLECALHGTLFGAIQTMGPMKEDVVARYIHALARVLAHLHRYNIIHRDIKPENVVIGQDNEAKLTDFGWAVLASEVESKTFCGTLDYLSPEIIRGKRHDHRVDIWGLGVLCFELLFGVPPFFEEDYVATTQRITHARFTFPNSPRVSEEAIHFISSILVKDPKSRISLEEILDHSFLKKSFFHPYQKEMA